MTDWRERGDTVHSAEGGGARGPQPPRVMVEVSPAELLRRITLLEIAAEMPDLAPRSAGLAEDLARLVAARDAALPALPRLDELTDALRDLNVDLAAVQADLRECARRGSFADEFVALSRAALRLEEDRARLESNIDAFVAGVLMENRPRSSG